MIIYDKVIMFFNFEHNTCYLCNSTLSYAIGLFHYRKKKNSQSLIMELLISFGLLYLIYVE
jgi:hypothetical protein